MIKLSPPAMLIGKAIDPDRLWKKFHVRVISVRSNDVWEPLAANRTLSPDDQIIIAGAPEDLERFATG